MVGETFKIEKNCKKTTKFEKMLGKVFNFVKIGGKNCHSWEYGERIR